MELIARIGVVVVSTGRNPNDRTGRKPDKIMQISYMKAATYEASRGRSRV